MEVRVSPRQVILRVEMDDEMHSRRRAYLELLQTGIRVAEYTKKKGDPQSFRFWLWAWRRR